MAHPGKPVRIVYKFRTRKLTYEEYANSTAALTDALFPNKTYFFAVKFDGELGQICGVKDGSNQPILGEVNGNFMFKSTQFYRYKWVSGSANQKPTIYGSNIGLGESVNEDAICWTSVPALKATRVAAGLDAPAVDPTSFGALDMQSRHMTDLNPYMNCTGETREPTVLIGA